MDYLYIYNLDGTNLYHIGVGNRTELLSARSMLTEQNRPDVILYGTKSVLGMAHEIRCRLASTLTKKYNKGWYTLTVDEVDVIMGLPKQMDALPKYFLPETNVTLYSLVKYINWVSGREMQHSKVMYKVNKWTNTAFGPCRQINYPLNTTTVNTLELTNVQCIAIAGTYHMSIQLAVIDRLQYVENKYGVKSTQNDIAASVLSSFDNITVYGLLKYIFQQTKVKIDHSKVLKRKMTGWMYVDGFGTTTKISIPVTVGDGATRMVFSYTLTPRQCVAVAGSLSIELQMLVCNRLDELERLFEPNHNTADTLAEAVAVYRDYVDNDILPTNVSGPGIYLEKKNSTEHVFQYAVGKYIVNPETACPILR